MTDVNIIQYNARSDNLKRSYGHWFLDMAVVSAIIPANTIDLGPLSSNIGYWGISGDALNLSGYKISWEVERNGTSYTDLIYIGGGVSTCSLYTIGTKEYPMTQTYGKFTSAYPDEGLLVGKRANTWFPSCLSIPVAIPLAANPNEYPSVFDWTISGGIEVIRVCAIPGEYSISAFVWDPPTFATLQASAILVTEYKEISCNIYAAQSSPHSTWYVDISAIQWTDPTWGNTSLPPSHIIKWDYDSTQGFILAYRKTPSLVPFFATPNPSPTATVNVSAGCDNVRFLFNTPGIKNISAEIVEYDLALGFENRSVSAVTDSSPIQAYTVSLCDFLYMGDDITTWDTFQWTILNPNIGLNGVSGVNVLSATDASGGVYSLSSTVGLTGDTSWASPTGTYPVLSSFVFYCSSSYPNFIRNIIPYYGKLSNIETVVAAVEINTDYFYTSSLGILGSSNFIDYTLSGVQLYGSSNIPAILPPNIETIYWENCSIPLFKPYLMGYNVKEGTVYDLNSPTNVYPTTGDLISAHGLQQGAYAVALKYTTYPQYSALFLWNTFDPQSLILEQSVYNNCSYTRTLSVSAETILGTIPFLILGNDISGNNMEFKWRTNDPSRVIFRNSNGIIVPNNTITQSSDCNPIYISIIPNESTTPASYPIQFAVDYLKSDNLTNIISSVSTSLLYYDDWPSGLNVDFNINSELYSQLPVEGIYRFVDNSTLVYTISVRNCTLTAIDNIVYNANTINLLGLSSNFIWYIDGQVAATGVDVNLTIPVNGFVSSPLYIASSIQLMVTNICASPLYISGHCISKDFDITLIDSTAFVEPSGIYFPAKVWSGGVLSSLDVNPSLYWSLLPYPSAYGDGNSMSFYFTSYYTSYYNEYRWIVNEAQPVATDTTMGVAIITSTEGIERSITATYGAFNDFLQNYSRSTYNVDGMGGVTAVFPNWNIASPPIKMSLYDSPTSITISNLIIPDIENISLQIFGTIDMDTNSVVVPSFINFVWLVSTDQGIIYNAVGDGAVVIIPTTVSTAVVYTTAIYDVGIPSEGTYSFVNATRTSTIGPCSLKVYSVDFTIDASTPYTTLNTVQGATAFPNCSISGTLAIYPPVSPTTYEWNVNGDIYTDTSWISSFTVSGSPWHDPLTVAPSTIPISLTVDISGTVFTKSKNLVVRATPPPLFIIYPHSYYGIVGSPIVIENLSQYVVPISEFVWKINTNDLYFNATAISATFLSAGIQNIFLSAMDAKEYLHTALRRTLLIYDSWETYTANALVSLKEIEPQLPASFDVVKIPPNEWVTADNFNRSMQKLEENLQYLNDISTVYKSPPVTYTGTWSTTATSWKINGYDADYNIIANNATENIRDVVFTRDNMYVAYKNRITILTNTYDPVVVYSFDEPTVGVKFVDIESIGIDTKGRIIVFDQYKQIVYVIKYDPTNPYNVIKTISYWGGLGGPAAKYKFMAATHMTVSDKHEIYITDNGNKRIKKYTQIGSWLATYELDEEEDVISLSVDSQDRMYVLTNNKVIVLNTDGTVFNTILWRNFIDSSFGTKEVVDILASKDLNIFYICVQDGIIKYTIGGGIIGYFGRTEYTLQNGSRDFKSIHHIEDRNFYIVDNNFILQYIDFVEYLVVRADVSQQDWNDNDYRIDKDEYVQYWTYNKCFHRFFDNLTVFKNALVGKILIVKDATGKGVYKIYPKDKILEKNLTYVKNDIFIGVNEFVTAEVVNRCLYQLYVTQSELLDLFIKQTTNWRWIDTTQDAGNPTRWIETFLGDPKAVIWSRAVS